MKMYCSGIVYTVEVYHFSKISEESSAVPDVGVDALLKHKKLDRFLNGPVYWVDSADSQPSIGQQPVYIGLPIIIYLCTCLQVLHLLPCGL